MAEVQAHPFFGSLDFSTLYTQTPPPLAQGPVAAVPHASWARRQNSIMWSPLPQRYAFGEDALEALEALEETSAEAECHFTRRLGGTRELPPGAPGGGGGGGAPTGGIMGAPPPPEDGPLRAVPMEF